MGITKKVSKQFWDKSDAKKKRDAGQLESEPESKKPKKEESTPSAAEAEKA